MARNNATVSIGFRADLKEFSSKMQNVNRSLKRYGKQMQNIGSKLSVGVTLPILAIGAASIKSASDGEETASKFNVVFSDIGKAAQKSAEVLRNSYGLSSDASKQLLSDTGDLLTGFGFSQDAALDLSTQVNKLAVDLASFTNFSGGAEGASIALTKALLGERESIKSLGISILEEDVKSRVLINTKKGLTFESERQAKAFATLQLAQEQSRNALGDYERTSGSFANQLRLVKARFEDLSSEIGQILLPYAAKLVESIKVLVQRFSDLPTATKKIIIVVGALVAALGPLLFTVGFMSTNVIPGLISVFGVLKVSIVKGLIPAFTALKAAMLSNPFIAIATAITTAATALYLFAERADSAAAAQRKLNEAIEEGKLSAGEYEKATSLSLDTQIDKIKARAREEIKAAKTEKEKNKIRAAAVKEITALIKKEQGVLAERIKSYAAQMVQYAETSPEYAKYNTLIKQESDYYNELTTRLKNVTIEQKKLNKAKGVKTKKVTNIQTDFDVNDTSKQITKLIGGGLDNWKGLIDTSVFSKIPESLKESTELASTHIVGFQQKLGFFKENVNIFTDAVGASFSALGSQIASIFETGNVVIDAFIGSIINSLTQLATAFVQQLVIEKVFATGKKLVDQGKASSNAIVIATNAAAAMGPFGIAALPGLIASQLALVQGAFAAIPKFADGGIMPGNSPYGDKLLAYLNSGELILNKPQQKVLYENLNTGSAIVQVPYIAETKLSGADIKLVLKRQNSRDNRTS